jgi:hypothetical protein
MAQKTSLVTIGQAQHPFICHVCQGRLFFDREIKLNTTGMELLGIEWMNESATGLICAKCGYLHTFVNDSIELWESDRGYPQR